MLDACFHVVLQGSHLQAPGPHLGKLGSVLLPSSLSLILLFDDDLRRCIALSSPKTSIFTQKRYPYTGNLNSDAPGDSNGAFLHCGGVFDCPKASNPT